VCGSNRYHDNAVKGLRTSWNNITTSSFIRKVLCTCPSIQRSAVVTTAIQVHISDCGILNRIILFN
jgi:hypothetical protein